MNRTRNDFYKLGDDIKRWHIKTFHIKAESQYWKVEEELLEFYEHPCIEEYSDCFIAIAALAFRFDSMIGKVLFNKMVDNMLTLKNCDKYYRAIVHKFEVDKIRRFEKKGKVYRHIEEK